MIFEPAEITNHESRLSQRDCSCTVGPSTWNVLPLLSLLLNVVCAVCAVGWAEHQRDLSVAEPFAEMAIFMSLRFFTTRPSNLSIRPVIVTSAPPVSFRTWS